MAAACAAYTRVVATFALAAAAISFVGPAGARSPARTVRLVASRARATVSSSARIRSRVWWSVRGGTVLLAAQIRRTVESRPARMRARSPAVSLRAAARAAPTSMLAPARRCPDQSVTAIERTNSNSGASAVASVACLSCTCPSIVTPPASTLRHSGVPLSSSLLGDVRVDRLPDGLRRDAAEPSARRRDDDVDAVHAAAERVCPPCRDREAGRRRSA